MTFGEVVPGSKRVVKTVCAERYNAKFVID